MTGFFDGGTKSLSFGEVNSDEAKAAFGKWRGGPIINLASAKQQTDWQDRSILKTWPNGDPVMQLPITLDTRNGRCPEPMADEDDDGVRDWYITKGMQPFNALKIALRKAKVNDIAVGGELYGRWVSGVGKKGDPRIFEFVYTPPVAGSGGFMDDDGPAAQQPPAMPPQDAPRFDPNTGQPLTPPAAAPPEPPRFDPASGAPLNDAARAVLARHATPAQSGPPAGGGVVNPYARQ
jgi:hypothetical protein